MFTREQIQGIVVLTDAAQKMERMLAAIGIEQSVDERILFLGIRKAAQEMLEKPEPAQEKKA